MTNEEIKALLALLQSTNVTLFELEQEGVRIKIQKSPLLPAGEVFRLPAARPSTGELLDQASAEQFSQSAPPTKTNTRTITAPIVGTFYRSPSPEAAPYVEVGSVVQKGQILCIIEAMKLMNEIESEFEGTVKAVLMENGQSVEYGMPLIEIEIGPET
ncbi:acetyl-CoA carboxylase biotin carboxyl carrier protein [Leptospirillum ferriphilum]|uniref:Biotin carboxyl carrier protein of acetyl-CoA carboxylase n=2 Tax=Leptospirillum TaxID=179 RepID=A0A094X3B5_9BACT|nr:acetyl-CoA carboxylase biotin carboxyl carrier protein [Leptospirillum ferriphilum]EDZ39229.1 MAG: Acetyl-CoA biotin carboxyl carrier protein [Leptospirillum sp. Group II '5-way CG']KGA93034.1 Biotin carboxyl carrier protein of acetyl-CoA carboxylase [Leptospirillum ferriphilum]